MPLVYKMVAANISALVSGINILFDCKDSSHIDNIDSSLNDIKQICLFETPENNFDLCCSVLFDKQKGVQTFLYRVIGNDELQSSKAFLLEFLSAFIQRVGRSILPYSVDIKNVCLSAFVKERLAKVKVAALPVVIKLLELSAGSGVTDDMEIPALRDKMFSELTKSGKLVASVKRQIYVLMGVISEVSPEHMVSHAERLISLYTTTLKNEMTAKTRKPEMQMIAGCLEGLTSCLMNFTQSVDEGSKYSYDIFKAARSCVAPEVDTTRYDIQRAALALFSKHSSQFGPFLLDEYEDIYSRLHHWTCHHNRELQHLGVVAMEAFLKQISEMLIARADEGKKEGAVFKFFMLKFHAIMSDNHASNKQVSLAIRGYGLLAAPCRVFLSQSDVQFMLADMLHKSEQHFMSDAVMMEERILSLPSYLEALANIVKQMHEISDTFISRLIRLAVLLFEQFPMFHYKMHYMCIKSLMHLMLAIQPKAAAFAHLTTTIVYQGVIRTCSHPVVAATDAQEPDDMPEEQQIFVKRQVSYKDFVPLWMGLLDSAGMKELGAEDIGIPERLELTQTIYDELVSSTLKIINLLDFTSTTSNTTDGQDAEDIEQEPVASADILACVQAVKPKDFQIFINLVDFTKDLLPSKHAPHFEKWLFTFGHALIQKSSTYPLVSGFYKLLASSMVIAGKLRYFTTPEELTQDSVAMETSCNRDNSQVESCCLLFTKFTKEVLVRMNQYRDDLLASCLTFILSLPTPIVVSQLDSIIPALQVAFSVGQSYLPLAFLGLEALELWSKSLPDHLLQPHYHRILPCLDAYLSTKDQGAEDIGSGSVVTTPTSKTGRTNTKKPTRLIRVKPDDIKVNSESQLSTLKLRILTYLGSLGGRTNHLLLSRANERIADAAISWDTESHLRFTMPFIDMKPIIYLDAFLPRVVDLALTSSDRQTKVVACELLHSLVIFTVGRSVQQPSSTRDFSPIMEPIYRKLFPSILKLACDVEKVARQLFDPLVKQLIHWFTGNKVAESPDTMSLLDSIFDGAVQGNESSLRDYSAKCLQEFLKWSIKQGRQKAKNNSRSILKRLYSFCLHPSACKRLGAALAFNNIYTVFREEKELVDAFTFEILHHFVDSLALANADDKSLGTQEQCKQCLVHIERIIVAEATMLSEKSAKRTQPRLWREITLEYAVRWLLQQCGRPQTECRHSCMRLVFRLAPLIKHGTTQNFFATFLRSRGSSYFIERFENGGSVSGHHGISQSPTLHELTGSFTLTSVLSWFDMLLAALDCYTWVFGESLLTPKALFADGTKKSQIFTSVKYFLSHLSSADLTTAASLMNCSAATFSPREIDLYNKSKCTVLIRTLNFVMSLLQSTPNADKKLFSTILCEDLWSMVCAVTLHPTSVGFNLADVEVMMNLPKETEQTLMALHKLLPAECRKQLMDTLARHLDTNGGVVQLASSLTSDATADHVTVSQTLTGYHILHKAGLLNSLLSSSTPTAAVQVFDAVYGGLVVKDGASLKAASIPPSLKNVFRQMLSLAFHLDLSANNLLEALLDKTPVENARRSLSPSLYGDLFYSHYKEEINAYIATRSRSVVPLLMGEIKRHSSRMSSVLSAALDCLIKNASLRKSESEAMVSCMLHRWEELTGWWSSEGTEESLSMAYNLISKVLLINSKLRVTGDTPRVWKVAYDPKHPAFAKVFTMYTAFLSNKNSSLAFKSETLDLLPFFCGVPEPHISQLKTVLDTFVSDNLPLRSRDYNVGSSKHNDFIAALDKLLAATELSGSTMLLRLLVSILCREPDHIHETRIQSCLCQFIEKLPRDKHQSALAIPYEIFRNESGFSPEIRARAVEKVLLSLTRATRNRTVLVVFFKENIASLVTILETKLTSRSESVTECQLYNKLSAFRLIEVMYTQLEPPDTHSKSSVINERFCAAKGIQPDTGKEMSQAITKAASDAKSEDMRGETVLLDLFRRYHCAAYNALIAIISSVQTDVRFYSGFLFKENEAKGQFLYGNLIDIEKTYEFHLELSSALERKKKFVSIRSEVKVDGRGGDGDVSNSGSDTAAAYPSSLHLATQYLADSSLLPEVTAYNTVAQSQTSAGERTKDLDRPDSHADPASSTVDRAQVKESYIELEADELNQHECMATLIGLLRHMYNAKVIPHYDKGVSAPSVPTWMEAMVKKMGNSSVHVNIKLFLARLIINLPDIFEPYAKFWYRGLLQLVVSGQITANGLTYMVVDLVVTMLSWHDTAIPADNSEERALASRLTEHVMFNCYHSNRQIYRNNIEMLRTVLSCWKSRISISYRVIYNLFRTSESQSRLTSVGVQLLGVVIANNFDPYGPDAPVDRERYLESLSANMKSQYVEVYGATSEVVGLILNYLAEQEKNPTSEFHEHVVSLLTSLQGSSIQRFIVCVHNIQKHYPPTADKFINKLLFILPGLHGWYRRLCLEVLLARIDYIDDVYMQLKQKNFHQLLKTRDEAIQLVCLKIVHSIVAKLKLPELSSLMPCLLDFVESKSVVCRNAMFAILMWVYDNYRDNDSDESLRIMTLTKDALLKGLADDDLQCRVQLQNFWTSANRLPANTLDRLVAMLEAMYSPSTESHYLSYCTNLLLQMTSNSPDYSLNIFEHPLSECSFVDYNIESSWRQRHFAMTPLFAHTQVSQSVDDSFTNQIRATVDENVFTPTQALSGKAPFNWLTQSSLNTFTEYSSASLEPASSLLFTFKQPPRDRAAPSTSARFVAHAVDRGQNTVSGTKDNTDSKEEGNVILRLKRRFVKDRQSDAAFFMRRESRKKQLRQKVQREREERRQHQVTLYRRYRIGDLPDIQIKYSYIIAPLQAAAQRDSTIAKLLFAALFKAIFDQMKNVKTDREVAETIGQIKQSLEVMLDSSSQYYPPFISCILDIIHSLQKQLSIDPNLMGSCAVISNLQPLGIVLLEDKGLVNMTEQPSHPAKRAKVSAHPTQPSTDTTLWLELARLYKTVGEFDVLRGIFGGKIDTDRCTSDGISAEARMDYAEALRIYKKLLGREAWPDGEPTQAEVDLWSDSCMSCCENLARWSQLEKFSTENFNTDDGVPHLENVWQDSYFQEHYLPHMLRSKLKLMLSGDDNQQTLLDFVDVSMKDPVHKSILENRYSTELAMMYLWQENYDRARHYSRLSIQAFLQDWCDSNELVLSTRRHLLHSLHSLVELQEFLAFIVSDYISMDGVEKLVTGWEKRSAHVILDSVSTWCDVADNRHVYMEHLWKHLSSTDTTTDLEQRFMSLNCRFQLDLATAAQTQGNYSLALKILKDTHATCRSVTDDSVIVKWSHLYARTHQSRESAADRLSLSNLLMTFTQLENVSGSESILASSDLSLTQHLLQAEGCELLVHAFLKEDILSDLDDQDAGKLMSLAGCNSIQRETLIEHLINRGYDFYKSGVVVEESSDLMTGDDSGKARVKLANFCDKLLRLEKDEETTCSPLPATFPETVVVCLLAAMKLGSLEACYRYPRVLQLAQYHPSTIAIIQRQCMDIPSWTFIPWIGQIMAVCDKVESLAVHRTLLTLAEDYPHAVIYPYMISSEGFKFTEGTDQTITRNKQFAEKLESLLNEKRLPQARRFVAALEQFTQPEHVFKDWRENIKKELSSTSRDIDRVKHLFREMFLAILNDDQSTISSTYSMGALCDYRRQFAQKHKKTLLDLLGQDGSKLLTMSPSDFSKKIDVCIHGMDKDCRGLLAPPIQLNKYSHWMSEYNNLIEQSYLEIPGQYSGFSKPMPEYHVKVAGFDQRVLVLPSLRKPKKVTIRGSDERDYGFLVKGGEDLRQDQRLEQLFELMNHAFVNDASCRHRKLSLATYRVIPMTTRVGLIEWVDNTKPLKELLNDAKTSDERKFYDSDAGPMRQYRSWLQRFSKSQNASEQYRNMYMKASHTDVTHSLRTKEAGVPWDLSRRALTNLSTSAEAFYMLRESCLRSYGLMSICQYLVGIGDRHLNNTLINLTTGCMVGIDFGHAFGTATQFLGIPELMPMRLTRQIMNLGLPLDNHGLLESTMIHGLRALRRHSDLLLSTMDVFIKEPSADWITWSVRQKERGMETSDADIDESWYPKQRVQFARRKFSGANPTVITCEELYLGHSHLAAFENMKAVTLGDASSIRAQLPRHGLTVEQQVAALIDQATDPNILGRMYFGWEPWV